MSRRELDSGVGRPRIGGERRKEGSVTWLPSTWSRVKALQKKWRRPSRSVMTEELVLIGLAAVEEDPSLLLVQPEEE